MKKIQRQRPAVDAKPAERQSSPSTAETVHKHWSVKVTVRLPHKIGLPLGCGGNGDGGPV